MKHLLESLKFVQGAIGSTRLEPRLSYFLIKDGYVTGTNGHIQLSSPIDTDAVIAPRAREFVRALEQCEDEIEMFLTQSGNLRLTSGEFTAVVPAMNLDEMYVLERPTGGETVFIPTDLLEVVKMIKPYISDDASRDWSTGVLMGNGYAYATNNIIIARFNTGLKTSLWFNLPLHVIDEMVRINDNPNYISIHRLTQQVTLHYPGHRLLHSTLGPMNWPDLNNILRMLDLSDSVGVPVDELLGHVEKIKHFLDKEGRVFISPDAVFTSTDYTEQGAIVKCTTNVDHTVCFHHSMLQKIAGEGNMVDLNKYPGPCPVWNPNNSMLGAIVGVAI